MSNQTQKPKFIKLCGGLGNQMFQYAFGRALEAKLNSEVLFDDYWFTIIKEVQLKNGPIENMPLRNYELDLFGINLKTATRKQIKDYFTNTKSEIKDVNQKMVIEKNPFEFDPEMFTENENRYYNGYFQNETYFQAIKDTIKKEFTLPEIPKSDKKNYKLLEEIKKNNSVFIHIRRGDYLNLGIALDANYYKKAVEYMLKTIKKPKFYVFGTDCEDFIKKEFKIGHSFKFVGTHNLSNNEDWKDMKLMQECKHAILANSTFCWWAAYLSDYAGKIVVAPTPWMEKEDGIICDNWVKINSQGN